MDTYTTVADDATIDITKKALEAANMTVHIAQNGEEAKTLALSLVPEGAEVMAMTSETLRATGIADAIKNGNYKDVHATLAGMNRETQNSEMQKLGAAPDVTLGSVHAVTQDGTVLIASNTGSQLGAYAYGSNKVVWVVGAQKIVKDFSDGMKRVYEHVLPLESERAKKAYGMERSNVSKMLVVSKEVKPGRIHIVLVKEALGF